MKIIHDRTAATDSQQQEFVRGMNVRGIKEGKKGDDLFTEILVTDETPIENMLFNNDPNSTSREVT